MTREELYQRLENGPLILDGATGSNLQKAGMPTGVCPELWIMEHEDVLVKLQNPMWKPERISSMRRRFPAIGRS